MSGVEVHPTLVEIGAKAFYLEDVAHTREYDWRSAEEGVKDWYRRMAAAVIEALGIEQDSHVSDMKGVMVPVFRIRGLEGDTPMIPPTPNPAS